MVDERLNGETLIEAQIPGVIKLLERDNEGKQTHQSALLRIMFNLHKAQRERNPLAMQNEGFEDYQVVARWGTKKYGSWDNVNLLEGIARTDIGNGSKSVDFFLPEPDETIGYFHLEWEEFDVEAGERQYIIGNAGGIRVYFPKDAPEGLRFAEDTSSWKGTEHYWAELLDGVRYPVSVELGRPGHPGFVHLVTQEWLDTGAGFGVLENNERSEIEGFEGIYSLTPKIS